MNKIFFIGFNKTGTTTYDKIVGQQFKSTHNTEWARESINLSDTKLLNVFKKYTCYSDGEMCNFKRLDELFPDSKFILNDRNIKNWLYSRIRWVHRANAKGWMKREYFSTYNKQDIIRLWIKRRQDYYRDVKKYFGSESEKFMSIDIEKDDIIYKLSNFLKVEFFADHKIYNKAQVVKDNLENELRDVDQVLEEYSKDIEYFGYKFGE